MPGFEDVKKLFDELGINPLAPQPTPQDDEQAKRQRELNERDRQFQQDIRNNPRPKTEVFN